MICLRAAREYGLRVLLTPWDTFWMSRRWHKHPYNADQWRSGARLRRMFLSEATMQATIRRLHFVIERWGAEWSHRRLGFVQRDSSATGAVRRNSREP